MPIEIFLHLKLDVADLNRSLDFYCGLLGFEQVVRYDRSDGITIVQVSPDGQPPGVELWYEPPHGSFALDRLHFAFKVVRLTELVDELRSRGVIVEIAPFRMGHEAIAFLRDPDGYLIELNEEISRPSRNLSNATN